MTGYKTNKLASVLRQSLATTINKQYPQLANSLISIHYIDISPDMSWADIYCTSILTSEEQQKQIDFLQRQANSLRYVISQKVHLKKMPALRFHSDQVQERSRRIDQLLAHKS